MFSNPFQKLRRLLAITALTLAAGCVQHVSPPIVPRTDPFVPDQIHMTSDDLRQVTAVQPPIVKRDDSGLIFVTVPIRAATDSKLYVDYRVTFFDRGGEVISKSPWTPKTLPPNIPDQIMFNSSSSRAVDFQVDLRFAE